MILVSTGVCVEIFSRFLELSDRVPPMLGQALNVLALILICIGSVELALRATRPRLLVGIIVPATLLLLCRPAFRAWLSLNSADPWAGSALGGITNAVLNVCDGVGFGGWIVALFLLMFDLIDTRSRAASKDAALRAERNAHARTGDLYQELVENATEVICRLDAFGTFEYVSPSVARVLGYAPAEVVGENCFDFVNEADQDSVRDFYLARIRGASAAEYIEFGMRRKDGSQARLGQTARILRDDAGKVSGYISVTRDMTAQYEAEEAQREIAQRYRVLADAMGVIHWEASLPTWQFTYITPRVEQILGYTPEEWYALGFWTSILHPDDHDDAVCFCQSQTEGLRDHEFEYRMISKSGEAVWIRDYVQVVVENGEPVGLRGFMVDVSMLKSAEEEKRALERARQRHERLESLGLLAGSIAHDFNNLLVSLIGHAELAQMCLPEGHRARKHAGTILDIGRQAAEFCGQLLAYSGHGALTLRNVHMNDMVREVVRLTTPPAREPGTIIFQLAENLPSFRADIAQLRQVTMNLFTNALDATADGGSLVLSTGEMECSAAFIRDASESSNAAPGRYVYLEVRDTGCGMSETDLAHVMEPFFSTKEKGTGLGLAGAQGILRSHDGFISMTSRLGEGTTSRVYFPLEHDQKEGPEEPANAPEETARPERILIIDDDQSVLYFAGVLLERKGFEVLSASNAGEGIEVFAEHAGTIRTVLVDFNMPGMNGDEAARKIHEIEAGVPIILMSGEARNEIEDIVQADEFAGFIAKPFTFEEIEEELAAVMER